MCVQEYLTSVVNTIPSDNCKKVQQSLLPLLMYLCVRGLYIPHGMVYSEAIMDGCLLSYYYNKNIPLCNSLILWTFFIPALFNSDELLSGLVNCRFFP